MPGRGKRRLAQQEDDLLANAAAVKERLKQQRERIRQEQEAAFFKKQLNERQTELGTIGALRIRHGFANVNSLTQTLEAKKVFENDLNDVKDYHGLAQRLPLVGIIGAMWLNQQPAALKRFVFRNLDHLNIANFQTLVPQAQLLCSMALKITDAGEALQILALPQNGATVADWIALMTRYPKITGHQSLINLCTARDTAGLVFPDCAVLKQCLECGKDPKANKWLSDEGLNWEEIKSFVFRMKDETEHIQTCTTLRQTVIPPGLHPRVALIKFWLKVPNCSVGNLVYFVANYSKLQAKETITTKMVARLLSAGLLKATKSHFYQTTDGMGQTFIFMLPNQGGRIPPEWHIHFAAAGGNRPAKPVGAGWKLQSEKHTRGTKLFGDPGDLPKALGDLWKPPTI